MKKFLTGLLCLIFSLPLLAQEQFTLSGYIREASNGEALIGATVYIDEIKNGTVTNVYGFYSVTLPKGAYHANYQYIGFGDVKKEVHLDQNIRLDLELEIAERQMDEVIITGDAIDANVSDIEMSTAKLDIKTIDKMPAFVGEVDIIKSIQMLPGVSTVGEGAPGFNVRGGSVGQNLVVLDEAPVYQSSHLFGFFSVFNPDAVKDVKLYKGGIPAKYGGRLSSILDIRMKEGNSKKYEVNGGVGTVFSRLAVEGPIKKDKSSFIIAGRRSYADVLAKPFTDVLDDGAALYFYDLTAKANFNINPKNRVYVSGYLGRDVFKFDKFQGFDWGNRTATLRWNNLANDRLFSNYTFFYSLYDYGFEFGDSDNDKYGWKSHINTFNFKPEYSWFINAKNELTFGGELILYRFEPATTQSVSNGSVVDFSLDERKALEASLYIGNDQQLTDKLSIQYGIRYSNFNYLGGREYSFGDTIPGMEKPLIGTDEKDEWEVIQSYGNFEPRFSFRYQLTPGSSVKGSYNRMVQYIHLISNTTASTPIDVWQPSTNNIKPQIGDQVALGYFRNFNGNRYEFSTEVYYKWMQNQVDYIDGADIFGNAYLESQLLRGEGRAYGLELMVKKNKGRLTGWASYTLGKSELKTDGINYGGDKINRKGNWYPARFDQRHNLKIAGFYDLSQKISVSANFTFLSGTPVTYPTDRITVQDYVIPYIGDSKRNNVRIPDYHRLDVSLTINKIFMGKKRGKASDYLVISFYNLYARENPFSIYFSQGNERHITDGPIPTSSTQLSIVGTIIPAFSYNFKF